MTIQLQPVRHFTTQVAHIVGNLITHYKKSNTRGFAEGGGGEGVMIALGIDPYITLSACGSHLSAKDQEGHIHCISFLA